VSESGSGYRHLRRKKKRAHTTTEEKRKIRIRSKLGQGKVEENTKDRKGRRTTIPIEEWLVAEPLYENLKPFLYVRVGGEGTIFRKGSNRLIRGLCLTFRPTKLWGRGLREGKKSRKVLLRKVGESGKAKGTLKDNIRLSSLEDKSRKKGPDGHPICSLARNL